MSDNDKIRTGVTPRKDMAEAADVRGVFGYRPPTTGVEGRVELQVRHYYEKLPRPVSTVLEEGKGPAADSAVA